MNNFNQSDFGPHDRFWTFDPKTGRLSISIWAFISFLGRQGFGKVFPNGTKHCIFIRVQENIIDEVTPIVIKDYIANYLETWEPSLLDIITYNSTRFFSKEKLEFLPKIELNLCQDTKDVCWLFFRNGAVKISKNGDIRFYPYKILPGQVLRSSIIDRDFNASTEAPIFAAFIKNVCDADRGRIAGLTSAICHLIHRYKDPSSAKMICLLDQAIRNHTGGTGKDLIMLAVSHFRKVLRIDARKRAQNQFIFQGYHQGIDVLYFADAKHTFNIGQVFNAITGDLEVEGKGKDSTSIPFESAPKLALSSNFPIEGSSVSHRRRLVEIELFNYYDDQYGPEDEFGHRFFSEWSEEEWSRFDSWIVRMMREYLQTGLVIVTPINLQFKRLISQTSECFALWLQNEFELELGTWYAKGDLADQFNDFSGEGKDTRTIVKWFKAAANLRNLQVEESSHRIRGKVIRVIRFVTRAQRRPKHQNGPDLGSDRYLL